ncbi:MAG TPA: Orange carotenoid protein [Leptolyngbyaceae cyanobacterium M33_DOE_097]|uniref:Orange carotenoid protein n=1 Tax=Oscillatoriales cyanobacterium SpSt-418 TaxID=2282169 RepID=A0A7C3PA80_9CYAN|nr:Orange carotenoid protein [Leptolyngbyaceae cyanobacterium M33_DOE_097]
MTFAAASVTSRVSNPYLAEIEVANAVAIVTAQISQLTVDDQLALLWYAYTEAGRSVTPAALGSARLQLAEGLLNRVKQLSYADQLQFMRDLVNRANNELTRAYGVLSTNTKLALWYQLAEWMTQGIVVPMPSDYISAPEAVQAFENLKKLDMGQQITILRNLVVDMGVDPLAL